MRFALCLALVAACATTSSNSSSLHYVADDGTVCVNYDQNLDMVDPNYKEGEAKFGLIKAELERRWVNYDLVTKEKEFASSPGGYSKESIAVVKDLMTGSIYDVTIEGFDPIGRPNKFETACFAGTVKLTASNVTSAQFEALKMEGGKF